MCVTYRRWADQMGMRNISPQDLYDLFQAQRPVDLIDVRTSVEYGKGHIEGARLVPLDALTVQAVRAGRRA